MRLIQSNRLEVLADALAEALRAAPFGPFDQPVVVVPSTLMERWLTLELVDRLGFLANVRFELPAVCAWRMMASVVPEVSADSPFAADALRWRLMGLLRQGTGVGTPVDQYLAGGGASGAALARYRLASELAALYEQYATYRSDWLEGWTRGAGEPFGDAHWQAPLWKKLVQRMPGVATRHPRHTFIDMLGRDVEALARLPCCLFLFNPDALPPVYLEIFAGVARHVPVSLYLFNPSQEYWTDVRRRDASLNARLTAGQGNGGDVAAKDGPADVGVNNAGGEPGVSSLLAGLGQHGRPMLEGLIEADLPSAAFWHPPARDSLLGAVQSEVFLFRERPIDAPYVWRADDRSIEIHDCHSPMREAEVLHDLLLARFQADPRLQPEDVAVYVCGTGLHAAALSAVFAAVPEDRRIPFSSYPAVDAEDRPLVQSVLAIIGAARGRGLVSDVLALLEEPACARHFHLEPGDIPGVAELLRCAGVRWGWDEWSWAEQGVVPERQYTWAAGIERLLLGAVMSEESSQPLARVAPAAGVEGSDLRLLGALCEITSSLSRLAKRLREQRAVAEWMLVVAGIIDEFHDEKHYAPDHARALRSVFDAIAAHAESARYGEAVPFDVAFAEIEVQLARARVQRGSVAGGVRLISLAAGHVVPARVVCVVGANDGLLPSPAHSASFDLMARHPRHGDRNPRDAQRYAFLQALLGAREAFIVLFDGRSVRDNAPLLPAPAVTALRETVARMTATDLAQADARLTVTHPLQPFSTACFSPASPHASFAAEWLCSDGDSTEFPFMQGLALPIEPSMLAVTLADLERFFRHPAKFFFQRCLGLSLPAPEEEPAADEPFDLGPLDQYNLREELVRVLLEGGEPGEVAYRSLCAGRLPPGAWGPATFERCLDQAERIAQQVRRLEPAPAATQRIDLELGDVRITGAAAWPTHGPHVLWRPGAIRAQDLVRGWLQHLVRLSVAETEPGTDTVFIGLDAIRFSAPGKSAATELLRALIDCYRQGLARTLPFFPETSLAYAEAERKAPGSGRIAAARAWEGSSFESTPGEPVRRADQDDPYFALATRGQRALGDNFERVARAICMPMLECLGEA